MFVVPQSSNFDPTPFTFELMMMSPSITRALEVSMLYGGPAHLKLIAEWEMETKANVFGVVPDVIPEPHESVNELIQVYQQPLQCSLTDCLHIYTKEETVSGQ